MYKEIDMMILLAGYKEGFHDSMVFGFDALLSFCGECEKLLILVENIYSKNNFLSSSCNCLVIAEKIVYRDMEVRAQLHNKYREHPNVIFFQDAFCNKMN